MNTLLAKESDTDPIVVSLLRVMDTDYRVFGVQFFTNMQLWNTV